MPLAYSDRDVTIELLPALGRMANNAYILRPANGGPLTLVDVPEGFEAVIDSIAGSAVERVIVTHSHGDHWAGYELMRAHTDAPVFAGAAETNLDESRAIGRLADGAEIVVGGARIRVLDTPGHTPGSICLHIGGAVLTGDTLFPGGPGHTRSAAALQQEIASITSRLHTLDGATLVLPGHGDGTTIAASRAEYAVFASHAHAEDLHGDVLWAES